MTRNNDRRFGESWERYGDWVDHSALLARSPIITSVTEELEKIVTPVSEILPMKSLPKELRSSYHHSPKQAKK